MLPNPQSAVVPLQKLREYCLNLDHPRGNHKARVFASALGLTADDAAILQRALLEAALHYAAFPTDKDDYGQRYVLDFPMVGPTGEATVRSAWIVRTGEEYPRLTSCYVL